MATRAQSMIQDQDLNVHFNVAPILGKADVSKAQKSMGLGRRKALNDISNSDRSSTLGNVSKTQKAGGFGGRKALNDISNSERASALKIPSKLQSKNTISIGKDTGQAIGEAQGKSSQVRRKALGDVTNLQCHHGVSKKSQPKKISVLQEVDIFQEGFLHNHDRCIEDQFRDVGWSQFSDILGLDKGGNSMLFSPPRVVSPQLDKLKVAGTLLPEYDDEFEWSSKLGYKGRGLCSSPCPSPYTMKFETPNFRLKD